MWKGRGADARAASAPKITCTGEYKPLMSRCGASIGLLRSALKQKTEVDLISFRERGRTLPREHSS